MNPNQAGGWGQICPQEIKIVISPELNVGFTSNQAVNLSLFVSRDLIKKR